MNGGELTLIESVCEAYTDILLFLKKSQCLEAAFAADAAVFNAAEWCAEVAQEPAVYPDDAGFEGGGHAVGS